MPDKNSGINRGSIIGRVSTIDGKPVIGANVLIIGNSPPHNDIAVLTDSNGEYRLSNLIPGEYEILFGLPDHTMKTLRGYVSQGRSTTINLVLNA
jgi:hypothetical protein